MGVPKFYRWISERYPCLSEVVKENQIPEFDNLYLDMNGIIHPCSHPNDEDVHFRITEQQIFEAVFHYIEVLFRIIKPRKVFFMAVDGVAPRAKMNQQRGRRFRSAREAEEREKEAIAKGEILPTEKRFDSNCITPGTPFMVRLHEQLKYFVRQKLTKDPTWQGLRIYLSGQETPGEGEHKIMDFIRYEKARPDYDPNTRHCLYGLDADLIMLGLISHEPHFSLLREEVRFGKIANQKRPTTPEETTFNLLHLSLMREYLEIEFSAVKPHIDWYDMERIIDDWVLMGYLVGNDFIPHLPNMHISHNALPLLYKAYIEILPSLGGYLNEHGTLNLHRFEKYMTHLSKSDRETFEETFTDLSFFAAKTTDIRTWKSQRAETKKEADKGRRAAKANANPFAALEELMSKPASAMNEGSKGITSDLLSQDTSDDEDGDTFEEEFRAHKRAYYDDKFEIENITDEQLSELVYNYILAIQWILDYYYNGIQSWGWYYPYHYAPFMSDLRGFSRFKLKYEKGKPFLPFQQLLGVLPAASKELLPEPYQRLMTLESSPIIDYYPLDFASDLNGKLQQWEAVVLIPFIDEKRLLAAMEQVSKFLTKEEKSRNVHGPHLLNTYDETLNYKYDSSLPGHFPDISACSVRCLELDKDIFHLDPVILQRGLRPGAKTGVFFPGFPTLHHLKFTTKFGKEEVKVFQQNSRGESVIMSIRTENPDVEAGDVANDLVGKSCFAEWPHLRDVKVVAVADDTNRYELVENKQHGSQGEDKPKIKKLEMSDYDAAVWVRDIQAIQERYLKRKGVRIGPTYVLVYACPLMGRRYVSGHSSMVTLEKQWSLTPVPYAYQMVVKDIAVHDSTFTQFKTLEEVYPQHSHCFMLGTPNYGTQGSVIDIEDGRVRALFTLPVEANLNHLRNSQSHYEVQYMPSHVLAQRLGLTPLIISRLSGTIYVGRGSRTSSSVGPSNTFNIGLNLKFNKSNQEVQGYSKKDETGTWLYSSKVIGIIKEYIEKFPEVFAYISRNSRADNFFEDDLFRGKAGRMKELQDFIKELPCSKVSKVASGLKNLDEPIIKMIEDEVKKVTGLKVRKQKLCVRPHLLFKPLRYLGNLIPDPQAEHELFDRVVNIREGYTVPLGLRGVIVGIEPGEIILDNIYEVVFDEEFPGGLVIRCTGPRGYRIPTTAMINISYGLRREQGQQVGNKPTAVVKPQMFPQPSPNTQSRGWYSDMVGRLGTTQTQRAQQQQQQQQQQVRQQHQQHQQQAQQLLQQQHVQAPAKSSGAVNYRAAVTKDNTSRQPRESKASTQPAPPMTILTRSGPKPITRSPTKESKTSKDSSRNVPPRLDNREDKAKPRNQEEITQMSLEEDLQKHNVSEDKNREKEIDNEAEEFANMWRKLQKMSGSGTSSPAMENPSIDALTPPSEEEVVQPSIQMQQALSALPNVKAPGSKVDEDQNIIEEGEDECEGEVFEEDHELRMTPRTYVKSGTEKLCQMLNIASMSDPDKIPKDVALPHSIVIEASSGRKHYGIPVTLDQLFAGATDNQSQNKSSAPSTSPNPANIPMMPHAVRQPTPQPSQPQAQQPGQPLAAVSRERQPSGGGYSPRALGSPGQQMPHGIHQGAPLVVMGHMQQPGLVMQPSSPKPPMQTSQLQQQQQQQQQVGIPTVGHQTQLCPGFVAGHPLVQMGPQPPTIPGAPQQPANIPSAFAVFKAAPQSRPPNPVPTNAPLGSFPRPLGMGNAYSWPSLHQARPPFIQQQPRQPTPHGHQPSPQDSLRYWCLQRGMRPPAYHFQRNNALGQFQSTVFLSTGQQFFGLVCQSEMHAAHSAAHVAMMNLTAQPRGPMPPMVRPTTGPSLGVPMSPQGPMIHATGPNPFVPLQVTKQLNSPARSTSGEMDTSSERPPPEQQMEAPTACFPSQGTSPRPDKKDSTEFHHSRSRDDTQMSSQSRQLDFGSATIQTDTPVSNMKQPGDSQKTTDDVTTGTVHSEKRVPTSVAASKRRRSSTKAKLAINFGVGKN